MRAPYVGQVACGDPPVSVPVVRVFVPSTLVTLARAAVSGELPVPGGTAFAVTPASVEMHTDGDVEELEMLAAEAAAARSLCLLAAVPEPAAGPPVAGGPVAARRVVVAVDVLDTAVTVPADWDEDSPDLVELPGPVAMEAVASVLADPPSIAELVNRALPVAGEPPPQLGALPEGPAWEARDEVEASPLLWFDATEIEDLTRGVEAT